MIKDRQYLIYMDVCCLNRPFDDWTQERVRFEAEAILAIFTRFRSREWMLISSEAVEAELGRTPDLEKAEAVLDLLSIAAKTVSLDKSVDRRSEELMRLGFTLYDSFHIACAEAAHVDVMLTTDDRLLRRASRHASEISVTISNPVVWLVNINQTQEGNDNDSN